MQDRDSRRGENSWVSQSGYHHHNQPAVARIHLPRSASSLFPAVHNIIPMNVCSSFQVSTVAALLLHLPLQIGNQEERNCYSAHHVCSTISATHLYYAVLQCRDLLVVVVSTRTYIRVVWLVRPFDVTPPRPPSRAPRNTQTKLTDRHLTHNFTRPTHSCKRPTPTVLLRQ